MAIQARKIRAKKPGECPYFGTAKSRMRLGEHFEQLGFGQRHNKIALCDLPYTWGSQSA